MQVHRAHRPLIIGREGAVASNHPLASQTGVEILKAGGNAVDAAVAISLMLGVVEPHMSGLGGDGFYHTFQAANGNGQVYNGAGLPPRGSRARFTDAMPLFGPLSASVPGALAALSTMHLSEGTLPWRDLCRPAIRAARHGFGVTFSYYRFAGRYADRLLKDAHSRNIYLHDGAVPAIGSMIVQETLAQTLEMLADEGADTLYRGALSERMADDLHACGVPISQADLAAHQSEVTQPISIRYRGFEVRQTPPNSTGFVHLQTLKIIENFDMSKYEHLSPEVLHILIEAKKLAFRDRERFATDPNWRDIPVQHLLSDAYTRSLFNEIDTQKAAEISLKVAGRSANTTYFCVMDKHGNAVSAIQSLNNAFGSCVTLPSTGILMNNRMTCWHLDEDHANALADGKRVRHTMNAPMILKDGRVWGLFGTPGADDQIQTNLQIAVGLMDFDLDPQSLLEAPRWSSDQAAQEANWPHGGGDTLTVESDMPQHTVDVLQTRGHTLRSVPPLEGPCSAACIRTSNGAYIAGSDPRRDGWAAAF